MRLKHNFLTILMIALASTLLIFSACEKDEDDSTPTIEDGPGDPVTDIDGNTYQTVWIGGQNWMAENLKTITYNDGTPIDLITDNANWESDTIGAYCWYDNDEAHYAETYGALYNWYVVNTGNLCPDGWHVPTEEEWLTLEGYIVSDGHLNNEGTTLKATYGWNENGNGTNDYGFTALPGGCRYSQGHFYGSGEIGRWWTATEFGTDDAHSRGLSADENKVGKYAYINQLGFSVRCVRD
ncbi:MAG: FISUMP domain-containing protein [Bacteroidota bacterium]